MRDEVGQSGVMLICTEPLSREVCLQSPTKLDDCLLACSASIIENATWLLNKHDLDKARKLLWGTLAAVHQPDGTDPYGSLYVLLQQQLTTAYMGFSHAQIASVLDFLQKCVTALTFKITAGMSRIVDIVQHGLRLWIEDAEAILAGYSPGSEMAKIHLAVRQHRTRVTVLNIDNEQIQTLWEMLRTTIRLLPHTSATLAQLQPIITSAFMSRHQTIVNEALSLWNETFGLVEALEYPDALRLSLLRVKKVAEISLPGLEDDLSAQVRHACNSPTSASD